jgi:hypothetical protein
MTVSSRVVALTTAVAAIIVWLYQRVTGRPFVENLGQQSTRPL